MRQERFEVLGLFQAPDQRPKRSILFLAVTAEEKGLLGSEYLGKHSPIPVGKITLNLNYDDLPALGVPEEVQVSGAERTTFYPIVAASQDRATTPLLRLDPSRFCRNGGID